MTEKIGIMGGTFDPIHYGHLLAAEECRRQLELDRVIFIPTGLSSHKRDRVVVSPEHRYAMTLLATAGVSEFSVSRTEIDRGRPSHTVDTLRELIDDDRCAGKNICRNLFFITGLDALLSIGSWKEYMSLPSLCTIVTATRPGYSLTGIEALPAEIRRVLKVVEMPQFAISSTEIRFRVRGGNSIRFLVPHLVEKYIEHNGLYKESEVQPI